MKSGNVSSRPHCLRGPAKPHSCWSNRWRTERHSLLSDQFVWLQTVIWAFVEFLSVAIFSGHSPEPTLPEYRHDHERFSSLTLGAIANGPVGPVDVSANCPTRGQASSDSIARSVLSEPIALIGIPKPIPTRNCLVRTGFAQDRSCESFPIELRGELRQTGSFHNRGVALKDECCLFKKVV